MKRSALINPDYFPATWEQIKAKRDELELAPIELDDGRVFDFDKDAIDRFNGSIKHFSSLTTKTSDGLLGWKLFNDDTEFLSQQNLADILAELETKQAIRSGILHYQAQAFKASPPTVAELNDLATWGI